MWLGGTSALIILIIMLNGFIISSIIVTDSAIKFIRYWNSKKRTKVQKIPHSSVAPKKLKRIEK